MISINLKKGVSVLYVIFVVSILFAISFGISGILIPQVKMLSEIGNSVVAFYAADSGIEEILMTRGGPSSDCVKESPCFLDDENEISYYFDVQLVKKECNGEDLCIVAVTITSTGNYQNTKRAIEINY